MSEVEIGLSEAIKAIEEAARSDKSGERLSHATLKLVADFAWEHQFDTETRTQMRRQLVNILDREVTAVEERRRQK